MVRERILTEPELFLKTQRRQPPASKPAAVELQRDLEMAVAILHRASRRLGEALPEMDGPQREQARRKIESARGELDRLAQRIGKEAEAKHAEPSATNRDSGTELALDETLWLCLSDDKVTRASSFRVKGVTKREIARVLKLSRLTVRKVLRSNSTKVPEIQRAEKAEPYRQQILDLLISCKGNLVRVHEELTASGAALSYPALTAFCRRQGIGQIPVLPAGQYHFEPGVEMQHDTSPHEVEVGGRKYKAQTASGVLCYSRLLFFQINPTFQRFDCKVFLTDALRYMGGSPARVMIDNTLALRRGPMVSLSHDKPHHAASLLVRWCYAARDAK